MGMSVFKFFQAKKAIAAIMPGPLKEALGVMKVNIRIAVGLLLAASLLAAQRAPDTPDAHVAAAKVAAGDDYQNLFSFVCAAPAQRGGAGRGQGGGGRGAQATPDRSTWHAEPVKVFDNLYWFGQTEYSVWALTKSDGIIVFDAIFDYSIEDEVYAGVKKMGLD